MNFWEKMKVLEFEFLFCEPPNTSPVYYA